MRGCAVDPYRVINDGTLDQYLSEIATFEDHQRYFFYPERNEWETPEDFILDMIIGDTFTSFQSINHLFDNQFDQIGLACDCHPTFKMMCVLEVGRGVKRAHEFYPDGKFKPLPELEEFDIDHVACYNGYDKLSLFMSKNFDRESGFCSEIN